MKRFVRRLGDDDIGDLELGIACHPRGNLLTQLIAIPLWDRAAEPLREQLEKTPGVKLIDEGDILQVGPLSVLLTEFRYGGGWLIAGTVTQDTVITAARELDARARYVDR